MMINLRNLRYGFLLTKKAKIYKKPHYQAIPHYHKPHYIDIHDGYTYRTKQQINKQLSSLQFKINITRHIYSQDDPRKQVKNRKAIVQFDIKSLNFTHLQLERFKILMGARFDEKKDTVKMACEMFPTYQQNFEKSLEQVKEVILQAKRAP